MMAHRTAVSRFQYSLANLVWCNVTTTRAMQAAIVVSVFSGESRVVQRRYRWSRPAARSCFSILWRISCGATGMHGQTGRPSGTVSVFSGESRVVQQALAPRSANMRFSFSILWRISCGATSSRILRKRPCGLVSVFSGESRVVQPTSSRVETERSGVSVFSGESRVVQLAFPVVTVFDPDRFSILWRISCGATTEFLSTVARPRVSFSILWRISCGATAGERVCFFNIASFQYSLANLVWCNPITPMINIT